MDRITELYVKSAHEHGSARDLFDSLRSSLALTVLGLGIAFNIAAPIVAGWWLVTVLGFH